MHPQVSEYLMSHVGDDPDAPVLPKFYAQHAEKGVINVGGHMEFN